MTPGYLRECAAVLQGFSYYRPLVEWMKSQADAMEAAATAQPAAMEPRCDRCRHWSAVGALRLKGAGKCMRLSPGADDMLRATWPTTLPFERCGEFAPREVKP